jgi:NADH-quinone oxidoreductase subunit L
MIEFIWIVPLCPLVGFLIHGLLGPYVRREFTGVLASGVIGLGFVISAVAFQELLMLPPAQRSVQVTVYTWVLSGALNVPVGFLVDPLSCVMLMVVSGVGCIIHVYSIGYMHGERGFVRYFAYLNLFVFAMLTLVSANNFLLMFVGWEGVGLCSYLLIGYYYERKSAADAGKKAFVVNRIGDFGFILGMLLIFSVFGTLDFMEVFRRAPRELEAGGLIITAITLLLFVGATGKSAQLPLYTWLPDAMEGPTPVSALIHAATMVTAGVYMVARCNVLYAMAPVSMTVVAVVGALTAIFAASIGLTQFDIKRVLAYSTISQLGYMFLACGVGAWAAGIFHLMTHAFFKALLFMGAGSVMHALAGELDMRKMGSLRNHMPRTYWTYLVGTLAIAGIFPFAGFFSKDEILFRALTQGNIYYWLIGATAAFMTSFYMFRTVFMTFHGESRMDPHVAHHVHESPPVMTVPLVILAFLSVIGGFVGVPVIHGGNAIGDFLSPVMRGQELLAAPVHGTGAHHSAAQELLLMAISLGIALAGWWLARKFYVTSPELPSKTARALGGLYVLVFNKYWVDELYDTIAVRPIIRFSNWLWNVADDGIIDWLANGFARVTAEAGATLRHVQTGLVQNYALSILVGVIFVLGYMVLR